MARAVTGGPWPRRGAHIRSPFPGWPSLERGVSERRAHIDQDLPVQGCREQGRCPMPVVTRRSSAVPSCVPAWGPVSVNYGVLDYQVHRDVAALGPGNIAAPGRAWGPGPARIAAIEYSTPKVMKLILPVGVHRYTKATMATIAIRAHRIAKAGHIRRRRVHTVPTPRAAPPNAATRIIGSNPRNTARGQ